MRQVTIATAAVTGLAAEPEIKIEADTVQVLMPAASARFRGAIIKKKGRQITIYINGQVGA